jgi:DNA primase
MKDDLDISERVLSDVRAAADIVDVIGESTALKKAGKSWKGLCPFHREKTPSFTVDRDRGLYYCFGCGAGGDVFGFIRQIERVDFREAVELLARRYRIEIPRRKRTEASDRSERLIAALADAERLFVERLWEGENGARAYLRERGVPDETAKSLRVGYAPDGWDFAARRLGESYPPEVLIEAGILSAGTEGRRAYDRFRNRLLFPIRDDRGRVVGFGGRSLSAEEPKYLNSAESPVFAKNRLLYGMPAAREAMRAKERVVLVEGYFDHLALLAAGVPETVATMGTALSIAQAERIRRWVGHVVVCYDGDAAGRTATRRAIPILLAAGLEVAVVDLPAGLDPFDYWKDAGTSALFEAVDRSSGFFDWLVSASDISGQVPPEEKSARVKSVLEVLDVVPDKVVRFEYVRRLAERAGIPSELLWDGRRRSREAGSAGPAEPPVPKVPGSEVPEAERKALQYLLRLAEEPAEAARLAGGIEGEIFSAPLSRNLFEIVQRLLSQGRPLEIAEVRPHIEDDGVLALYSELVLSEVAGDPREAISPVLKGLRRKLWDRQAEDVQRAIRDAEEKGDQEEIRRLYGFKTALGQKIHDRERPGSGRKN